MNPRIALVAVLMWGAAHAQSLISSAPGQPVRLSTSDAAVLDLQQPRDDLACSVTSSKPELGFDFMFQAGYEVNIPLKELAGDKNLLTIVLRVRSWRHKDQPIFFVQKVNVPAIEEDSGGNAVLHGVFRLGAGKYHLDWLMRDADERVCARFWDVEAKVTGKDIPLLQEVAKDLIQPVESTPFHEEAPVKRQPIGSPLRVKVVINFAPQRPQAAALKRDDLQGLVGILRKIDREPRIGSLSIVACSVPAQRVIYRQQNASRTDLPALGEVLKSLTFASVDARQLALKNGETEFLARLITEETREDHPDALIFVGPKFPLAAKVSREMIQHLGNVDYPVFYLNYSPDGSSYGSRDAMGQIVKKLNGHEYTISRPRDLFTAWSDVLSRILATKQPAESLSFTSNR